MTTTGYTDLFARTVAGGLGVATSGQTYTMQGGSAWSVAPGTATVAPTTTGIYYGLAESGSSYADITAQVALSAIPASNLATVGLIAMGKGTNNFYIGTMMVATGGAVSIRLSKLVAGGLVTLTTVATGLTYVANTFYNLRFQVYWSRSLQANVLSAKLWALTATEPGGWLATINDAAFTDYTTGTTVGPMVRDESSVSGALTAKIKNVVQLSYHLPVPDIADPMCADPAIAYPKQTALESLADATDVVMDGLADLTDLAQAFPRVRVSKSSGSFVNQFSVNLTFDTAEFNVGTPTNLGYDSSSLQLPAGIWAVTFEARFSALSLNSVQWQLSGPNHFSIAFSRPWASQSNDQSVYGTVHHAGLIVSTDPVTPGKVNVSMNPTNTSTTIAIQYMSLSAIKISDYFT